MRFEVQTIFVQTLTLHITEPFFTWTGKIAAKYRYMFTNKGHF